MGMPGRCVSLSEAVDSVPVSSFHTFYPLPPLGFQALEEILGVGPSSPAGSHESWGPSGALLLTLLGMSSNTSGWGACCSSGPWSMSLSLPPLTGQEGLGQSKSAFLATWSCVYFCYDLPWKTWGCIKCSKWWGLSADVPSPILPSPLQLLGIACSSWDTHSQLLPQGLCTCCSSSLQGSSSRNPHFPPLWPILNHQGDVMEWGWGRDEHQWVSQACLRRTAGCAYLPFHTCTSVSVMVTMQAAVWSPLLQLGSESPFKPYFM